MGNFTTLDLTCIAAPAIRLVLSKSHSCVIRHFIHDFDLFSFVPKLAEYNQLEAQLQKTVTDLDTRDRQLAANEQEVRYNLIFVCCCLTSLLNI